MTPIIPEPPEERLLCVLAVDTSGSMAPYAHELQQAIAELTATLKADEVCRSRVEVCLITFDDTTRLIHPFGPLSDFEPPAQIDCSGMTCTHQAIRLALDMISDRKAEYQANGIPYRQPWIWLFTDGYSNDADNGSFADLLRLQNARKLIFIGAAIGDGMGADELKAMHKSNLALRVSRENLKDIFGFAGPTIIKASKTTPGEKITVDVPPQVTIE